MIQTNPFVAALELDCTLPYGVGILFFAELDGLLYDLPQS